MDHVLMIGTPVMFENKPVFPVFTKAHGHEAQRTLFACSVGDFTYTISEWFDKKMHEWELEGFVACGRRLVRRDVMESARVFEHDNGDIEVGIVMDRHSCVFTV